MIEPKQYSKSVKLRAANLWQKTSAAGNVYFTGRLGGVRIVIFENRDCQGDDDATHVLYFTDGEKRGEASERGSRAAPSPVGSNGGAPARQQHRRPGGAGSAPDLLDDGDELRTLMP